MLPLHSDSAPDSVYIDKIETDAITIDDIFNEYVHKDDVCFLKIDTQGYEWEVLNGAKISLKTIKGVLLELSTVPLYQDQYLWNSFFERMDGIGFTLWKLMKGFTNPTNGRTLQFDGVFYRV